MDCWAEPVVRGSTVWLSPGALPGAVRCGVAAGQLLRGRFEPEHSLFLSMRGEELRRRVELAPEDPRLAAYLRGEQITADAEKGWCGVCVSAGGKSWLLGFAKASGGVLKNHYPKGLRNFK